MTVLIKGGTVVNADHSMRADVLCEDGKISAVGEGARRAERRDRRRCRRPVRDAGRHRSAHAHAAAVHGHGDERGLLLRDGSGPCRRHDDDHRLRHSQPAAEYPGDLQSVARMGREIRADYSFHVAITWWDDTVHEDMGTLVRDHGVNSFKHFMAYKGAIMADDEILVNSFTRARELGAITTVHAENGELVFACKKKCSRKASRAPRATRCPGRPRSRAKPRTGPFESPKCCACRSTLCTTPAASRSKRSRARVTKVSAFSARCWPGTCSIDDSVYRHDFDVAAAHVMSPPFRSKEHQAALWHGLQSGNLQTTATDHCCFCADQKAMGKDDFRSDTERDGRHREPYGGSLAPRRQHRPPDDERIRRRSRRPTPHRSSTSIRARAASRRAPMRTSSSGTRRRRRPFRPRPTTRRSTTTSSKA